MFDERSWIPLIAGIIMLAVGGIPLLAELGIITWSIAFLATTIGKIGSYLLAGGALFLIIDSFIEDITEPKGIITMIVGLLLLTTGILSIIGIATPILSKILVPMVYYILFTIEGIMLFIGAFLSD